MWGMDPIAVFEETDNPFHGGCYEDMKTSLGVHPFVIVLSFHCSKPAPENYSITTE